MSGNIQLRPRTIEEQRRQRAMLSVWLKAKPGMKVRCIEPVFPFPTDPVFKFPDVGEICTIRELRRGLWSAWAVGFTFWEAVNAIDHEQGSEPFFDAGCFEIVDDDD